VEKSRFSLIEIGGLEPVLDGQVGDYLTTWWDEAHDHYVPPANFDQLTRLLRANAHHESAVYCKRNTVVQGFRPGRRPVVSRAAMKAAALDYILYGNAYLRRVLSRAGELVRLDHLHARTIRRRREPGRYCQVLPERSIDFAEGEVIHVKMYAPESSVYGLPEYMGALNALLLNEQATLFRRKYYVNGAHMGFILFTSGADLSDEDIAELRKKVGESKGVGNFKSLYLHFDGEGQVELKPVGDFAKDDFEQIKNISRDDIISAHRVPPQILAVLTDNKLPATGDLDKVVNLYNTNVVQPLQIDLLDEINYHLEEAQQIRFDPYLLPGMVAPDA
jgi:PBSX family phage portal protein